MKKVAAALFPDNLPNMDTSIEGSKAIIHIDSEKITSLISVLDDLLMNAKIAEDIVGKKPEEE